ncbi:hypothetical protein M9H77_28309 [Catharanthus roseus]|uniref:Uncharacterized protein n=1 Tax=Catharanthus roseus TaxID=4058 RepID=A0ACC0AFL7_CATRO|nr:hypothetical protein M9H77_28309 [Catharanthus roseus]
MPVVMLKYGRRMYPSRPENGTTSNRLQNIVIEQTQYQVQDMITQRIEIRIGKIYKDIGAPSRPRFNCRKWSHKGWKSELGKTHKDIGAPSRSNNLAFASKLIAEENMLECTETNMPIDNTKRGDDHEVSKSLLE